MALFSSNLKKMTNELGNPSIDWDKLIALSSGKYELSGKNAAEGQTLINALLSKASDSGIEGKPISLLFRNIISHGGDLNRSMNQVGETPLHQAARMESTFLLKSLIGAGVQPASTTHSGATALHTAIAAGRVENVKLLLAASADPGAEDATRNAPLHYSVRLDNPLEIVQILLSAGAKAYQRNSEQKTAIDIAKEKGNTECIEILQQSLRDLRRNLNRNWKCPHCSNPIKRPDKKKIEWYISLDMWEHIQFTCGDCGLVSKATVLDGES